MLSAGGPVRAIRGEAGSASMLQALQRSSISTAFRLSRGRLVPTAAATSSGSQGPPSAAATNVFEQRAAEDRAAWEEGAFPSYLQSEVDDFCAAWSDALQEQDTTGKHVSAVTNENPVWQAIRREARCDAAKEPLLSSFYHASILSHDSFARSLAFVLANRLADATLLATELFEIFHSVLRENESVMQAALLDIVAFYERDPACVTYSAALLYFKGYHAIQTHRIAHILWTHDRKVMALALQARISEVLAMDIHPGAVLGKGLLLDHGTGVVIGETSRVGDNVSIMQNVTLGGTGMNAGSRHPQVESNVLIGAGATVLGNITVGKGAQVAAGSLVLKDVAPKTMVAGSPARLIGKVTGNAALRMQHQIQQQPAEELPPVGGQPAPARPDPFAAPQQQQEQHGQPSSIGGVAAPPSASSSAPSSAPASSHQLDVEDCGDNGAAAPHNSGNLADWVMSVAARPRAGTPGSSAPHNTSSNGSNDVSVSDADQHSRHVGHPQRRAAGASQQHGGGGGSAGGRGGVVAALALQYDEPELQLAPHEEDCEPDWMMSSAPASLAAWTMSNARADSPSHATAEERGMAMWRALHGQEHADHAAALRCFNNSVLAEAGILSNSSWSVSAVTTTISNVAAAKPAPAADVVTSPAAAVVAPNAVIVQEMSATPVAAALVESSHSEWSASELLDYMI